MRLLRLALLSAIASGAVAQTVTAATPVNIIDPNATTRAAHVEPDNGLAVQEVPPATYYHRATFEIANACTLIATPPRGKALIVRQVRLSA